MTPNEFEIAVENDFANQGYVITHVGKSNDKGVDFIADNGDDRIAVQVKMYETRIVRYQEFMYLYAGQKLYDCNKGLLITVNKIDKEAKVVATKLGIDYFENYVTEFKANLFNSSKLDTRYKLQKEVNFFDIWTTYIKPLKGKIIFTSTGKENLITNVTNDYLFRNSSTGSASKIEYKTFEVVYHKLLQKKFITRDEINTEYTKRGSAIITVVLAKIPNIELVTTPKIGLKLKK